MPAAESHPGVWETASVLSSSAPLGGTGSGFGRQSCLFSMAVHLGDSSSAPARCSEGEDRNGGVEHWVQVSA